MQDKKIMRTTTIFANALLLCTGSVVLYILSVSGNLNSAESSISVGIISFAGAILTFLFFIIEFIAALSISDSTFHTAILALFLFLFALFSRDMYWFFELAGFAHTDTILPTGQNVSFVGLQVSTLAYLRYDYCKIGKKLPMYPLFVVAAISLALFFALYHFSARIVACFFFIFVVAFYYIMIQVKSYITDTDNITFTLTSAIFFSCEGTQIAAELSYADILHYSVGLNAAYIWVCILSFLGIYLAFLLRTSKKAYRADDYKQQNEQLKMKVLAEQIKPHFIFNALTAIKSHYHSDVIEGDRALDLFSEYMRKSLSLIDTEKIPFAVELSNIANYIDFINTMRADPFRLAYDITCADFCIPSFSMQPFIENAVKYSNVNKKEDGCITISTSDEGDFIEVRISDNGKGFDATELKEGAHGINNAKERLKLLMNADVNVTSNVGAGTDVIIRIRRDKLSAIPSSEEDKE